MKNTYIKSKKKATNRGFQGDNFPTKLENELFGLHFSKIESSNNCGLNMISVT